MQFSGVDEIGLVDEYAFISANVRFNSLEFDLLQYLQVPICGEYITEEENAQNECPADGTYDFYLPYVIPDHEESQATWLVTGWSGQGEISFFSEANNIYSLIGTCQLHFSTAATQNTGHPILSKVPIPSALVTSAVLVAFVAFLALTCVCRTVRDYTTGKKKNRSKNNTADDGTPAEASFTALVD